ncbi:MAG: transporter [Myxococcota bacterium]|nr:transporter [Myxococcota bacterium]
MRQSKGWLALAVFVLFALPESAGADGEGHGAFASRPDGHAPIGVMGDHMHEAGEFMASYRFGYMRMKGNRDGTRRQSREEVLRDFPVTPTDMDMWVHMFGLMYAPTDWVTVTAMLPWIQKSMDHATRMGTRFTTTSNGIGDVKLAGLFRIFDGETHHLHLNFGWSFPTGQVRAKDTTPLGRQTLPFPMQIGSGTFDMMPGLTYVGHTDRFSWGSQVMGTYRIGENKSDWTASDQVDLTAWVAFPWTSWLSTSGRFRMSWWSNYGGDEKRPPPPDFIPTADPDRRAGAAFELLGGVNLYLPLGPLGKHRFAIEAGAPVEQWLDGPQLETDWRVVVGWQKAF